MRPVLTVAEMRAADASALEHIDQQTLVQRAGTAVALGALKMLGGGYGHRVVIVAGKGNNGADGKVAAAALRRRGAKVTVVDASKPTSLPPCDLVIDAAYGTGFKGTYDAPRVPVGARVLAIDIVSGLNGDDGTIAGRPMQAERTVTMAALKPGMLQGDGPRLSGRIEVADIGIGVSGFGIGLVEDADVVRLLPRRERQGHKWNTALLVVAGSPGMEGAAALSARGASHAGAGMVRLMVPGEAEQGAASPVSWPLESVRAPTPLEDWNEAALESLERCKAAVIGPGLGRTKATQKQVRRFLEGAGVGVVADADALVALGKAESVAKLTAKRSHPLVLTPHDGEYERMAGAAPGADRIDAARSLADRTGAIVLLKGPLTVVAGPGSPREQVVQENEVLTQLVSAGSPRLATAGTGDVLSGVIGAFLARGVPALSAASLGAHVHGRAAQGGPAEGLVAGDLPNLIARWLSEEMGDG